MLKEEKDSIITRLRTIRGHISGIEKMIEEEKDCPEVLIQVAAVTGSMKKIELMITKHMAEQCIDKALDEGRDIKQELSKILDNVLKNK